MKNRVIFALDARLCKACGICADLCPKRALDRDGDGKPIFARPEECIGCMTCEYHCPDFAIRIGREE